MWALLHHTGAQYSAGAYTSARVDVLNVGVLAPQLVPARRRINADRAMTLPRSAVRWSRYVSVLSSFTPRYVGVLWQVSRLPLMFTLSSRFVSRLFRWNVADTVLASLNLSRHCFSQFDRMDISWLNVSSIVFQSR